MQPEPDPLKDVPKDLSPEAKYKAEMNALGKGLSGAMKAQAKSHQEMGSAEYYVVVCFEHGDQVTAWLRAMKYPEPDARFVDGTILAGIQGVAIPPSPYRLPKLRKPDRSLTRLVTAFPKRVVTSP